jgi:succinate dehydrogenase / fumarate reductase, membrane anchor subunit
MGNGTSLGRVRGLGSAHNGAHHWLMQRYTAIGNVVLGVWFVASMILMPNFSYVTVHDWAVSPVTAVCLALLLICTVWHARLGMQVMFEDYLQNPGGKFAVMAVLNLAAFAAVAFGLFTLIRLALGA